jgi:hypothetical protein
VLVGAAVGACLLVEERVESTKFLENSPFDCTRDCPTSNKEEASARIIARKNEATLIFVEKRPGDQKKNMLYVAQEIRKSIL